MSMCDANPVGSAWSVSITDPWCFDLRAVSEYSGSTLLRSVGAVFPAPTRPTAFDRCLRSTREGEDGGGNHALAAAERGPEPPCLHRGAHRVRAGAGPRADDLIRRRRALLIDMHAHYHDLPRWSAGIGLYAIRTGFSMM